MRTWEQFYPDVLPDVLGCPEPTVDRHLQLAAIEFFTKSRSWRATLDPITTQALRPLYDVTWPDQAQPIELIAATLDGQDIDLEVADGTSAGDRDRGNQGRRRVLSLDLATVRLMPTPDALALPQTLRLDAILAPSDTALGVPDAQGARYSQAIARGALSTLLVINAASWANPQLAAVKDAQFKEAIAKAQNAAWKANTNRRPRTRGQYF